MTSTPVGPPRAKGDGVADLCNRFLTAKQRQGEAGEISARMFGEYKATTDRLVGSFGSARLVEISRPMTSRRCGTRWRSSGGRSGSATKSRRSAPFQVRLIGRHRTKNGERMLEADELRRLIDTASVSLKAMLLLGVNAGFANHDVATLPTAAPLPSQLTQPEPYRGRGDLTSTEQLDHGRAAVCGDDLADDGRVGVMFAKLDESGVDVSALDGAQQASRGLRIEEPLG